MKIQYVSDIHLEMRARSGDFPIDKNGDILLLAGDIGYPSHNNYKYFLQQQSLQFEKVFITTGNHEYYDKTFQGNMTNCDDYCREVCRSMPRQNVEFLQNDHVQLVPGINIFGGTFWTFIPSSKASVVSASINDYTQIKGLTADITSSLYEQSVAKLNECLESDEDSKWIVMSHHLPKSTLIQPKYRHYGALNYAFAGNISAADNPRILAWVYGHTHDASITDKFYCNPIGYPGENIKVDTSKCFEVVV